jgi:hypothetical protein
MAYSHLDPGVQQTQAPPRKGEDQDQHILREFKVGGRLIVERVRADAQRKLTEGMLTVL